MPFGAAALRASLVLALLLTAGRAADRGPEGGGAVSADRVARCLEVMGRARPWRDPFETSRERARRLAVLEARRRLVLEAIVRVGGVRMAVINGRTLAVGQRVRGWEVIAVGPNEVLLRREGRSRRLRLVR